jgi:hypothetical protein
LSWIAAQQRLAPDAAPLRFAAQVKRVLLEDHYGANMTKREIAILSFKVLSI